MWALLGKMVFVEQKIQLNVKFFIFWVDPIDRRYCVFTRAERQHTVANCEFLSGDGIQSE